MLKHAMVWWYITLWPQNTIWTPPKSFIHYPQTSQTVVLPKLPKFITNSKLMKIFWNLHLWHICIKVVSIKKDKNEEKSFSNNPLSKVRYDVSRSCLSTPKLATFGQITNLVLFKWPQIWHKRAQSHANWCLRHALPIWFEMFKKFMQKFKCKGYIISETSIDRTKIAS